MIMHALWWNMITHRSLCTDDDELWLCTCDEVWSCIDDEAWWCVDDDEAWLRTDDDELHDHACVMINYDHA